VWDGEREGFRVEKIISPLPQPSDVFTISFYENENGELRGARFTHENLTAGVAATRALLPTPNPITPLDTIVSAHPLGTAFGRAIAYTAIYEGTGFATLKSSETYKKEETRTVLDLADVLSSKAYPIPSPTILFVKVDHLNALVTEIITHAKKSWPLFPVAWRHKLAGVKDGFITKESLWDRVLLDGTRAKVIGEGASTLRGVIVSGGPMDASKMTPSRVALSIPLVMTYTHPLVAAPVLASHGLDLQDFPPVVNDALPSPLAHVGPPSVNVEVKLVGVDDALVENGADPVGRLHVQGPPVGRVASSQDSDDEWVDTGAKAKVQPNGSFLVMSNY